MEQYGVTGMSCAACQARVEKAVSRVPGVEKCSVSLLTNVLSVEGSADAEAITKAVIDAGYGISESGFSEKKSDSFREEMLKDRETPVLKKRLIVSVAFLLVLMYYSMGYMMFGWPAVIPALDNHISVAVLEMMLSLIILFINRKFFINGFKGLIHGAPNMDTLVAMGSAAAFGMSLVYMFLMISAQVEGSHDAVHEYSMNLYFESAAMIVTLITVGKLLEAISKGRTTDALKSLMKLAPDTATVKRDGNEVAVPIGEVSVGDVFIVRPGGNIPVDGVIISGSTAVNEAALTGESIPVDKTVGDTVSAATMNTGGYIECRAVRIGEDTTLSKIIKMVSDASATKAPLARIADKVSGVFVPVVMGIALLTFLGWMLIGGKDIAFSLARAISVLVISCPCALGLATPVAIMVGSGVGAKNGILYKTAEALELCGRVDTVVLDKTGTVTKGEPSVTDVKPFGRFSERELVELAAAIEAYSEHPLAGAVMRYAGEVGATVEKEERLAGGKVEGATRGKEEAAGGKEEGVAGGKEIGAAGGKEVGAASGKQESETKSGSFVITDFEALPGNGLRGKCTGRGENKNAGEDGALHAVHAGSPAFISSLTELSAEEKAEIDRLAEEGKTPLIFTYDDRLAGIIAVMDTVKEDSRAAISEMHDLGIKTVMLTGDNKRTAEAVARQVGVDEVIAEVLPDGKQNVILDLQKQGRVAMVGDGINDAPALTRADIGIAIGAGTDVAVDAAQIVLMKNSLMDAAESIRLSRATIRNIHENLFWAFIYNIICIPMAIGIFGFMLKPMYGAAAMSLSSFTVCMNALRLNLFKFKNKDNKGGAEMFGFGKKSEADEKTSADKVMVIEGMMCEHCEATVKKALEAVEGVAEAVVSHKKGTAALTLTSDVSDETLKTAVEAKDYKVVEIK